MKANETNEDEIEKDDKTRIEKILKLLRLDHLNKEEKTNVTSLVTKHAERFHLPGEALSTTSVLIFTSFDLSHLSTSDDRPINIKQYRYPQVHK